MGPVPNGYKYPAFFTVGVVELLITLENPALELEVMGMYLPYFLIVDL